jgi:hypothetical protein
MLAQRCPDRISILLPVYSYLFLLTPLNFSLNILLLFLHATDDAVAVEAPFSVFLKKHLPRVASTVSLATLLLCGPLLVHVSVAQESVGFTIGAALVLLALITVFASAFKRLLISSWYAGRGLVPALFFLCISTGTLISFDSLLSLSNKNHNDPHIPLIPIHLLLLFVSFIVFMFSITLLLIYIGAPVDGPHLAIRAENLVISPLSVAIATLLVGWYMKVSIAVTGMGAGPVEAVELLL